MIIPNKLYKGQIEMFFNEGTHTYYLEDEKIPSVTKILSVLNKPALINWAANQAVDFILSEILAGVSYDEIQLKNIFEAARKAHYRKREAAGNVGTFVHQWINEYLTDKSPATPINDDIKKAVEKFLKWEDKHKVKFLKSEEPIFSQKHRYAGTLDFIAEVDGELVLGDIKTSSGIWDEYWMQVAAYQLARMEEFPEEKYAATGIIRIDKTNGEFEWKTSKDFDTHIKGFLAARELFGALEGMKEKKEDGE